MFADSILFKKLEERSPKKAELIKEAYEEFKDEIEAIKKLFSDFTDHDISHCESVVKVLEELVIGGDLLENSEWKNVRGKWRLYLKDNAYLTEDEIVLLFLAILLHDIGMSPKIDNRLRELLDKAKYGEIEKDEIEEIKRIVRETHHIRSKDFIEKNEDLKELMEKCRFGKYIEALADIVEGHRIDPCDLFNKFKKVYDVRVPLLAFLLEIADDMDIGPHRVDRFISEDWIWFYLGKENIKHVLANMSVETFYREGDRVEYEVCIEDLEKYSFILELVYKWWDKIENRINRFRLVGVFSDKEDIIAWRYVLPSKVEFKVKAEGIDADWSKKFEVDRRVFADLLSSRVYEDRWEYAFRELIANCFDAIKMRAYEDDFFDNPEVKIDVKFVKDWVEIVIKDNGIGMSLRDIEDYLLKVGRSLYSELRKKDFEKAKAINPIGYYGIGFLSSFMLLRNDNGEFEGSIEVEIKKNGYDAVKVLILNPNLPVIKFKSDKDKVGTVIKIRCKNRMVKEFFECILKFVKLCKANGVDVHVFPFFEIISSVFVPITLILNMSLRNPNYIDLKKTKIEIPKEVLGELFKKLKDNEIVLYLIVSPFGVKDIDFEEIGAIDFVKSCLKFGDLYGDFLTLNEIKEMGKEPIIVDVDLIEDFKDECENLWNKQKLLPLGGEYGRFLTTCQKVSDLLFKRCKECKSKSNDCVFNVFNWNGCYITNPDFKDLCLRKDIFAVEVRTPEEGAVVVKSYLILDNPFAKAICEMWKNKEITLDEIEPIFEEIGIESIVARKGYATVKDIEKLANADENIKKCYESIKKWMEKQKQS